MFLILLQTISTIISVFAHRNKYVIWFYTSQITALLLKSGLADLLFQSKGTVKFSNKPILALLTCDNLYD